jgi:hypothetical protein
MIEKHCILKLYDSIDILIYCASKKNCNWRVLSFGYLQESGGGVIIAARKLFTACFRLAVIS